MKVTHRVNGIALGPQQKLHIHTRAVTSGVFWLKLSLMCGHCAHVWVVTTHELWMAQYLCFKHLIWPTTSQSHTTACINCFLKWLEHLALPKLRYGKRFSWCWHCKIQKMYRTLIYILLGDERCLLGQQALEILLYMVHVHVHEYLFFCTSQLYTDKTWSG